MIARVRESPGSPRNNRHDIHDRHRCGRHVHRFPCDGRRRRRPDPQGSVDARRPDGGRHAGSRRAGRRRRARPPGLPRANDPDRPRNDGDHQRRPHRPRGENRAARHGGIPRRSGDAEGYPREALRQQVHRAETRRAASSASAGPRTDRPDRRGAPTDLAGGCRPRGGDLFPRGHRSSGDMPAPCLCQRRTRARDSGPDARMSTGCLCRGIERHSSPDALLRTDVDHGPRRRRRADFRPLCRAA